ncbi:MAG: ThiF family adenylyltransferase [Gammaproteobacteria bacterium]
MNDDYSAERYVRQTILPEIGASGQARLARARVLVIGAGALGTPALYYLAAAGVGTLGIADDDTLELSNLHRQILYRTTDIGRPKVEAAAERLGAFNPEIHIETHRLHVDADNAVALIRDYDLVLDATDRLETKFLINDACAKAERVLVHAAVLGFEARVAVFDARTGPCLRCLFPESPATPALTCSEAGVLGAITGMAGSLQALEATKWLLAVGDKTSALQTLLGRLWLLDGRTLATRVIALPRDPDCAVCARPPDSIRLTPAAATVSRLAASELGDYPDALLIDVREDDEWAHGHLPGAVHCPLSQLSRSVPELPPHEHYIAYCAHGLRSETAARLFAQAGYRKVYSLSGGLAAMDKEALEI